MEQYIDKATVVAEIEREKAYAQTLGDNAINSSMQQFFDGMKEGCNNLLNYINALEVKEIDLEKEIDEVIHNYKVNDHQHTSICSADIEWIAEHFYGLGLKAQKGGEE